MDRVKKKNNCERNVGGMLNIQYFSTANNTYLNGQKSNSYFSAYISTAGGFLPVWVSCYSHFHVKGASGNFFLLLPVYSPFFTSKKCEL